MTEVKYYDGTKLLSMKDINGQDPEIYLCTSNRTAGKTTYFGRYMVNRFLKYGEKFMLVYRFGYELDDVANKFFKDIGALFFPGKAMYAQKMSKGAYAELFIEDTSIYKEDEKEHDGVPCGYAVALNNADQVKKMSHLFSDTARMFMDEFQSETDHYCPNEIAKLISIHTSIARGHGSQVKYLPIIMCGNMVSIINPYFVELGISDRLRADTKFLRGDGFVLEQGFNESASKAQKESAFNRAFKKNSYVNYAAENVYLNDSTSFVEKVDGPSKYFATIRSDGTDYAIRLFYNKGIVYCDNSVDQSFPTRFCVSTDDHGVNYVMLRTNEIFISELRYYFRVGSFRFKNLQCKQAVLKLLSY